MANYHEMWKLIEKSSFEIFSDLSGFVTCSICDKLLIDACESACGCIYCRKCINKLIIDKEIKHCPSGKDQCVKIGNNLPKNIKVNNHINKQISQLQVKCVSDSCKFECALINMVDHLNKCDKLPIKSSFNIKVIKKVDSSSIDLYFIRTIKDKLETEFADVNKLIDSRISTKSADVPPIKPYRKDAIEERQQDLLAIKQKIDQIMHFVSESTKSLEKKIIHPKEIFTKQLNTEIVGVDQQNKEEEIIEITLDNMNLIKEIIQLEKEKLFNENQIAILKEECSKQSRELKNMKSEGLEIRRELCQLKKGKHKQTKELNKTKREKEKLLKEIKILDKEKQIQIIPMLSVKRDNISPIHLDFTTTNISTPNNGSQLIGSQLIGSFNCHFNKISRIDTNNGSDKFYFSNNSIEIWLRMWPNGCRRGYHRKESNNICIDYLLDDGIVRHEDKERHFPRTYSIILTLKPKPMDTNNSVSFQQKVELSGSKSYQKIFVPSQFHFLKSDLNSKNIIKDDCVIIECDVELVHKSTLPTIV